MKTLFVYPNATKEEYLPMNIASLSATLKQHGHKTDLLDATWGISGEAIIRKMEKFNPDLVGFSVTTGDLTFSVRIAQFMKRNSEVPIIFGGAHPTVDPLGTIRHEPVDMVCLGEGELAMLELLQKMEDNETIENTRNIWFSRNGHITRNSVRPLVQDLDSLPFPDRELFDFRRYLEARDYVADFMASRGCPYACTYCINHFQRKLYKGMGKFVRFRSVSGVLEEIAEVRRKYRLRRILFHDDTFTCNLPWLRKFCAEYPKHFGIPFSCNARPEHLSREVCKMLRGAGCYDVRLGIESGNEAIRSSVLRRPMTNAQIIEQCMNAKRAGLKIFSFNMIGMPSETVDNIWQTIGVNKMIQPSFMQVSLFQPYPGTEMREMCEELGLLSDRGIPGTFLFETVLRLPTASRSDLEKFRKRFSFYVYREANFPKALAFLLRDHFYPAFIKYRDRIPLFIKHLIYKALYFLYYSEEVQIIDRDA